MPAEPMTLLLRPRNFFLRNPALDVPPAFARTPSQVARGVELEKGVHFRGNDSGSGSGSQGVGMTVAGGCAAASEAKMAASGSES